MKTRRTGFTMIELMIVIVIVAVLAAVVAPMLRARIERAKWSEAMAGCSAVATAVRAWAAENAENTTEITPPATVAQLGFTTEDLNGKYFDIGDYAVTCSYDQATGVVTYTITVTGDGAGGAPTGTLTLTKDAANDSVFNLTSGGTTTTF